MREGHLRRRRTVAVLVGRHFFGCPVQRLRLALYHSPHGADNWIAGRLGRRRLGLRGRGSPEHKYQSCNGYEFHVSPALKRWGKAYRILQAAVDLRSCCYEFALRCINRSNSSPACSASTCLKSLRKRTVDALGSSDFSEAATMSADRAELSGPRTM